MAREDHQVAAATAPPLVVEPSTRLRVLLGLLIMALTGVAVTGTVEELQRGTFDPGYFALLYAVIAMFVAQMGWRLLYRLEVQGERVRVKGPFGTTEVDAASIASVRWPTQLYDAPRLLLAPGTTTIRRTRRRPDGQPEHPSQILIPGLSPVAVERSLGRPVPDPVTAGALADEVREAFRDDEGRLRPLTYAYVGGFLIMILCVVFRVQPT